MRVPSGLKFSQTGNKTNGARASKAPSKRFIQRKNFTIKFSPLEIFFHVVIIKQNYILYFREKTL